MTAKRSQKRSGILAFMGGGDMDVGLYGHMAEASGAKEVLVLPAAAAFEHPHRAVERVAATVAPLGLKVRDLMALRRAEADDESNVEAARGARLVVICDGSPMHLRSVLKGSKLWDALAEAHARGAGVAADGAGAMVLCDPMVDPRGGAYTVGLGLVQNLTAFAHHDTAPAHLWERSVDLRPPTTVLVGIQERSALVREPDGRWHVRGVGSVTLLGPAGPHSYPADSTIDTLNM